MTPGARIETAVTLLAAIDAGSEPADVTIRHWARKNRYAGSGDRREIRRLVYGVIRHRRQLEWWLCRSGASATLRGLTIAYLVLADGWSAERIIAAFDTVKYGPEPMTPDEVRIAKFLAGRTIGHDAQPLSVRLNVQDWLLALFSESLGATCEGEVTALGSEACVDLRVNTLKATRETAMEALAADGINARPTQYSPDGLRFEGRVQLSAARAWRNGFVEVQDEGSQLVALLVDARPGHSVADFCAGAGGKTLALAAAMENRGAILACDLSEPRLHRIGPRLRRAGVEIVEASVLDAYDEAWIVANAGRFDRVLVDVPCSGTGAWRRRPETKWRLNPEMLQVLCNMQDGILESAARLVAPSGRMVYATCSVLREENQVRVDAFLLRHPEYFAVPADTVARDRIRDPALFEEGFLRLTPARHGTDGFFAAVLERKS